MADTSNLEATGNRTMSASEAKSIGAVWRSAMRQQAGPAYLVRVDGQWRPISREQVVIRVEAIANGLLAKGIERGDAFAILGRTSLEWVLVDFALALIGAIIVPIYPNESDRQVAFILTHSDAVGVFVDDRERIAPADMHGPSPALRHVIPFADLPALESEGRAFAAREPAALRAAESRVAADDIFTYVYTSGTTGAPKGCMLRHRNITGLAGDATTGSAFDGELVLLHLPVAHLWGRLEHLLGPEAGTVALCPEFSAVYAALREVRPTRLPTVPRVYEKIHAEVTAEFAAAGPVRRRTVDWALRVGAGVGEHRKHRTPIPRSLRIKHRIADRLVYTRVKRHFGGRLRSAGVGAASLPTAILDYFLSCDILLRQGYGLTECIAASGSSPEQFKFGTVGFPHPTTDLMIADDDEILMRGPHVFAGYYKDPEATAAAFTEDGWLRTGDIGFIDRDGFLHVTDRKKNLLVTAGGKNVAPEPVEKDLRGSPFISQALLVGNGRPYVGALLALDETQVRSWLGPRSTNPAMPWRSDPQVRELVQSIVDDVNIHYARFQRVKRFALISREFSVEEGELTPTQKLKRRICETHFASEIESLYAGE
jgi:long-chain acyl-CoA synthetase